MKELNRSNKLAAVAALVALSAAVPAHAELPAGAATVFTSIQTDGLALIDLAWPVMGAIVLGLLIMKLFKKVTSKAV